MICPKCGSSHPAGSNFCNECGSDLRKLKEEAPPLDFSQPQSYTPKHLADKILTTRSSIEGEKKLVTVLFADVANYTSIAEKLDPEEAHQIMDGCFKILADEIHRYEGTINQFTGDGVMALFGAPVAHEDHAQRACYAALSIQKALENYGNKLKRDHEIEFKMRIGLNSGPVMVGAIGDDLRMDYTAIGDTTNLAARIQQIAKPSQIYLSETTRNIIHDFFQNELVGEIPLKGKAVPQSIYRVVAERPTVRTRFEAGLVRGVTELVGRGPETKALRAAFERARGGDAQILDVVGEAGVGKSRLVYEFRHALAEEARFLTGLCIHYGGNINFLPVIDLVKASFGVEEEMREEEVGHLIEEKAVEHLASMVPFYRNLLSIRADDPHFKALDPEGRKFGTFEAVKDLLLSESDKKPLVVFLEDVHWMDKISEEFFTFFSRCMLNHPILMLSAYRPEGSPPWARGTHYQRLGLETLSSKSSIRLMRNVLGGSSLDPEVEEKIAEKAGGNPFFIEEIVRELLERGDLQKSGDRCLSSRPIHQLQIPNTIQGVLAARMDRLSEDLKRTMQFASVIGRDFAFRILRYVTKLGEDLKTYLSNLVGLEILYEKALYPELEYIFKHALTQEVAYNSLLKQRRQDIHGRIAQAIEELYAGRLEEHYEVLAHHYERSENDERAENYLILAGEKSNQHAAMQAAYDFFKKAYELTVSKDIEVNAERRVRLHYGLAQANLGMGAIGEAVEGFRATIKLCRRPKMIEYEKRSIYSLALAMYIWPERLEAKRILEEGIARSQEMGDKALESQILSWTGISEACYGSPYKGQQIMMDAERIGMQMEDPLSIFTARILRAWPERWLGRPLKAIELTEGALESLRDMFNFGLLSKMIQNRSNALAEVGRIEDAVAVLKHVIDISDKFGPLYSLPSLLNSLGYCYGEIHQYEQAWKLNLQSEEVARGFQKKYPMGLLQYAEMAAQAIVNQMENLFDQGRIDEAWDRIESFRKESRSDDYNMVRYVWESRMDYLAARILLHRNDLSQAETLIQKGLERAQEQHIRKREGGFLRLLGEVQIRHGESDNAIKNIREAIAILKQVANSRYLWEAHASLASAFNKMGRFSEARDQWSAAAEVIHNFANGLSDREWRAGFLGAKPVGEILSST
jgi:class 3 adenylate cyclase/tetratricopeptide (TPR) repeat protein